MFRFFLFPLEILFYFIVKIKNFLFDVGFFKTIHFKVPIISIGNMTMGGTGKTPHVAKIAEHYVQLQKRVVIVSRGYGGHYGGQACRVKPELDEATATYGDEPVWYAKTLNVPVYVSHDRARAVELCLQEQPSVEIIISDDSFQHRRLGRSTDIVLLDSAEENTHLLPRGRWREPFSSLRRAQYVILTKVNLTEPSLLQSWIQKLAGAGFSLAKKNISYSRYHLKEVSQWRGVEALPEQENVLMASSIAQPLSFEKLVCELFKVQKHFIFKDHHNWTQDDVDEIESYAIQANLPHLLITEKDMVKLETMVFKFINVHVVCLQPLLDPELPYEEFCK